MSELALCDSDLREVPADVAVARGPYIQTLNLSGNALVAPGNLQYFTSVKTLILDHNSLESLDGFPRMTSVTTLWFNNNSVSLLVEFIDAVEALFPNLVYLAFMRNPASPPLVCLSEEDTAASHRYRCVCAACAMICMLATNSRVGARSGPCRLYVLYRLPRLQFLDASAPTPAERRESAEKGQYMAVRKPKQAASSASLAAGGGLGSPGSDAGGISIFSGMGSGFDAGSASSPGSGRARGATESGEGSGVSPPVARKPQAHIMVAAATSAYDGRHSEGNRFIRDSQL